MVVLLRGTNGESRIELRSVATGALEASWPVRNAIFPSLEAAKAYAAREGIDCHVVPASEATLKIQAYADNFR